MNGRQKKILIGVILLLAIMVAVCAFLNRHGEKLQEGELLIKAGNNKVALLTISDLQKLPAVKKKMAIRSSCGTSEHDFTCTELVGVLNSLDKGLAKKYSRVVTKGIDNYSSGVKMAEVLAKDNVYIAYADGGKPLKTKTGKDGSLQIIIVSDQFGQRFTKYLVSLELEK